MSISLVLVSETRTVLTISFLQSPKLKKWSIERGNPWEKAVPVHRLGPCLMSRDKRSSQSVARKFLITNSKQLEQNKDAKFYRRIIASAKGFSWSSSTKSYWDGGITKIPEFYLRYARKTEAHRGPEHYYGISWKNTRSAKWSKLYERFQGFPGRWIGTQWKFSRYQSTNVIP